MDYCSEKSWYVLRVRSQAERLVHVGLHHKQFEVLNPTYQALSIRRDRRKLHIHVDAIPGSVMIDVESHQVQLEKDAVYQLVTNR